MRQTQRFLPSLTESAPEVKYARDAPLRGSLHATKAFWPTTANPRQSQNDREALERSPGRHSRPPRLAKLPDSRLSYRLRRPRAGRTHLVLAPT